MTLVYDRVGLYSLKSPFLKIMFDFQDRASMSTGSKKALNKDDILIKYYINPKDKSFLRSDKITIILCEEDDYDDDDDVDADGGSGDIIVDNGDCDNEVKEKMDGDNEEKDENGDDDDGYDDVYNGDNQDCDGDE
ncbi:nucleolar transcription factor 1-like [Ruditapes philippinarum]|uniref:nucleolar transcription factor 1-like n=1 Tax=Ruditapes philippinarum TaxID=129788 RepID=UPI00295A6A87|nr:nucleolar transcription factor 1-like [Ruditapes philippinarum]